MIDALHKEFIYDGGFYDIYNLFSVLDSKKSCHIFCWQSQCACHTHADVFLPLSMSWLETPAVARKRDLDNNQLIKRCNLIFEKIYQTSYHDQVQGQDFPQCYFMSCVVMSKVAYLRDTFSGPSESWLFMYHLNKKKPPCLQSV